MRINNGRYENGHIPWNIKNVEYNIDGNGCWNCTSHRTNPAGYPQIQYKKTRISVHRLIYKENNGDFDENLEICHHCDNPKCINPKHLFQGTHKENMQDMNKKGRHGHTGVAGEKHNNARLKNGDVLEIRKLYHQGIKQNQLAKMYAMTQASISLIVRGINWKHIKGESFDV